MRAGIVAIVVFAALLALGHYVAAPIFCRGDLAIPALDARALCGADQHLNRQGSVLLYFASIASAMFFGIIATLFGGAKSEPEEKAETKPVETFEQVVASVEAKPATAVSTTPASATPAAGTEEAKAAPAKSTETKSETKSESEKEQDAAAKPASVAAADVITAGLAASKNGARKTFEGTNEELLERFRELRKQEGVNSIAQAQRLLDESTLGALAKGIDPKQHLSQIAHLVLAEDPDLKSGVVRGVVVHVAARLKELGVVQQITSPAKPAA